ncbi:hypothetical protein [Phormidesmis priestleyi]
MTNQQTTMITGQTIEAKFYVRYWINTLLAKPIALLPPSSLLPLFIPPISLCHVKQL